MGTLPEAMELERHNGIHAGAVGYPIYANHASAPSIFCSISLGGQPNTIFCSINLENNLGGQPNTYPISVACIHLLFDQSSSQTLTQSRRPAKHNLLFYQSTSQTLTQSQWPVSIFCSINLLQFESVGYEGQ